MTPPLVLHVVSPARGGIAQHVRSLVRGLPAEGFACAVAGAPPAGLPDGTSVYRLPTTGPQAAAGAVRLARIVRRLRPAVVHAQGLKAGILAGLARSIARDRTPLVTTVHNVAAGPATRVLERAVPRLADVTLAVSEDLAAHLRARGADVRPIALAIPSDRQRAVRPRATVRASLGAGDQGVVCTLARLEPQKDVAVLLRAARQVLDRRPETRFWIAGAGPLENRLLALAERLDLRGAVTFLGHREDAPDLLAAADVVALPSRWEAVPFTVLEAAAAGVPVVATRVGGVPEVVNDGETGWLVPPGDPDALAAGLLEALADPAERVRRASAARERLKGRFDEGAMLRAMADLYRSMVAR